MDYNTKSLELHKKYQGKMETKPLMKVETREDLATVYTPGVAAVSSAIANDVSLARSHTMIGRTIAIVSDGSAVLGLGNIGPEAAMPVMEGKALLFKDMGGVDAVALCLGTQDTEEIINTITAIAPSFSGINLEDISAPRCFEIEKRLKEKLNIPVFHDDQHGTAIVVLAGLINSLKVVNKSIENIHIVINGAGAAGAAITQLLLEAGAKDIITCDSKGIISHSRNDLTDEKKKLAEKTNPRNISGTLQQAIIDADVFIGVSAPHVLQAADIANMNRDAIIMAMANPTPEIMPDEAKKGGARIVATGRSDFPNQVNNALVFPGFFKGLLTHHIREITVQHMLTAAQSLANMVTDPTEEHILPDVLDPQVPLVLCDAFQS